MKKFDDENKFDGEYTITLNTVRFTTYTMSDADFEVYNKRISKGHDFLDNWDKEFNALIEKLMPVIIKLYPGAKVRRCCFVDIGERERA